MSARTGSRQNVKENVCFQRWPWQLENKMKVNNGVTGGWASHQRPRPSTQQGREAHTSANNLGSSHDESD